MKAPRNEREFAISHKPVPPEWDMTLDGEGNVVPIKRQAMTRPRTPPVCGLQRQLLGAVWVVSSVLAVVTLIHLGPKVPKALDWVSTHLGAAVVNATTTGSPAP